MIEKTLLLGMIFTGAGLLAQADNGLQHILPQSPAGWLSTAAAGILAFMYFMDKRKVAKAETHSAILSEKDDLIKELRSTVSYHKEQEAFWRDELSRLQQVHNDYRVAHHQMINDINPRMLDLSSENLAMKTLLSEKGIALPFKQ